MSGLIATIQLDKTKSLWIHHPALAPNFFLSEALVGEYQDSMAAPR
jgi:hypothetical protein